MYADPRSQPQRQCYACECVQRRPNTLRAERLVIFLARDAKIDKKRDGNGNSDGGVTVVVLHDHLVGGTLVLLLLLLLLRGCHLRRVRSRIGVGVLDLGVAVWRVVLVVLETVEVLVALAARVAAVGFVLFHAQGARVRGESFGIDDGEGAVFVGGELLCVVAVLVGPN